MILACLVALIIVAPAVANAVQAPEPRPELIPHLDAIAALARSSPMVPVQEGWFLMGTNLNAVWMASVTFPDKMSQTLQRVTGPVYFFL